MAEVYKVQASDKEYTVCAHKNGYSLRADGKTCTILGLLNGTGAADMNLLKTKELIGLQIIYMTPDQRMIRTDPIEPTQSLEKKIEYRQPKRTTGNLSFAGAHP
jgi:hypothetical protein